MIDVPIRGVGLFKWLALRARSGVGEIDRLGHHQIPMAPEVGVNLLCGNEQEVLVGKATGPFEVILLLQEPLRSRVARIRVVVKVPEVHDINAQPTEDGHPARMVVKCIEIA